MALGSIMNTATLTQTFDGEFNNGFISSPDGSTGLWRTSMMNGNRTLGSNGEEEYYSDSSVGYNPFSVQNGTLDITAQPTSVAGGNALGLPYDSGVITTESSFNQLYGYFEIDAKLPAGQGLWPAFWLLPASGAWPPELDVFEVLGNNPSTLYFSTHSGVEATDGTTLNVANTSSGFNLYGVEWGPQTVDLYINNVEVASMPTPPDMNVPMYMLANLAVGGYWPGDPNSTTPFPATMQIAYIKAFAYPGTTGGTTYDTLPSQNIGAAPVAPSITSPGTVAVGNGVVTNLGGISVAANWPGGDFTVMVSDNHGLLQTSATNDVFTSGEDTTSLTLSGNLAAINAALATLTYDGTTNGDDWIWVGATDPQGQQGTASVVADVGATGGPVVTTPPAQSVTAGSSLDLTGIGVTDSQASGNVTLALSDATGLLDTTTESGVTAQGENTTKLTLTGSLAAINTELATLTYQAGSAAGTDSVVVAFSDAAGNHGSGALTVTTTSAQTGGAPVVTIPASFAATSGATKTLTGLSVADSQAGGTVTVVLSDITGLLHTGTESGVTAQGEGTTSLTLAGSLAAINTDLATLTYQASATAGTDLLDVSATANGVEGTGSASISLTSSSGTTTTTTTSTGTTPVVTAPAASNVTAGSTQALTGVSVAAGGSGTFAVTVSDSTGLLRAATAAGVTETGGGTTSLTLTGSLAAINADLASLTYQAAATAGTDWLWVSAEAAGGGTQGLNHDVVTVTKAPAAPVVTLPTSFATVAGTAQALTGISVADSQTGANVAVDLTDQTGHLATSTESGVTAQGEGTAALTLTGSLAAINADLATLTYQAAATAGTDSLTVSATANGAQDPGSVAITVSAPAVVTPKVTTPATATVAANATKAVSGVSVADSAGGTFSVAVSDSSGLLHTGTESGVTETGESTTSLTLTGSLTAINADLVSLTYQAGTTTGTDWLWVSAEATGSQGQNSQGQNSQGQNSQGQNSQGQNSQGSNSQGQNSQGLNHTVVTVTPPVAPTVTTPASFSAAAGTTDALRGISVADSQAGATLTVTLKDTTGLLTTGTENGVTETGESTTALTLTGSLTAINADLASLTYHATAAAGTDTLTVSATANGASNKSAVAIKVTAPPTPTPVVATPATLIMPTGTNGAVKGVSVADSAGGTLTVTVSDSNGLLHTGTESGVTEAGESTTSLTLTGSLAAINADLASLTYQAGTAAGTDWLWVSAEATGGPQGLNHAVVTVASPAPAQLSGLLTGTGVTLLDGASAIQGVFQIDGGHVVENTGSLLWNGGSIALGSGDSTTTKHTGTLNNAAGANFVIAGNGSVNSASATGSGTIINAGTLLKSGGTGDTTVFAALANTGMVEVTTGTLALEKAVSGKGVFELNGPATLDFGAAVGPGSTMRFLQPNGTLEVQTTGTSFGATILGFAGGDTIDAASVSGTGSTLKFARVGNNDTLTVSDGVHSAIFDMQGAYTAGNFHLAADGHGGTNITFI